ncbi:lysoplasmalogenase [Caldilinea sp.]|uniref:lysoplasmalogenase n=1 Tax=Caldilinea sp. TaxID=2293560 RepID=UPI002C2845F0|nr:lysoplasmalogenase [Anaerolineales bacterium]HQY90592.1 lysoplasmalogenase [Caldilinea sp.]
MPVTLTLTFTAIASGIIYIWAAYAGSQMQRYLFKPLTTTLILALALLLPAPVSPLYRGLIAIGILFSLSGDIFLMLPGNSPFIWGLVSFLAAHLFYSAGYVSRSGFALHWLIVLPFVVYGMVLLSLLLPYTGAVRVPVILYAIVLIVMGWQATEMWWALRDLPALLAMIGALLFIASDSLLALDKFRAPLPQRDLLVMGAYYSALLLIAWSVHLPVNNA